jgi:hypothetical protein
MKHNHHDDDFRGPVKQARLESHHPTASAEDFDDSRPEAETLQTTGSDGGSGMLSNQQGLELSQASKGNKHFLNTIQSVWPTPSA